MAYISVQTEDFDAGAEYRQIRADSPGAGALVTFCGLVREFYEADGKDEVLELRLEHYPGMTEKSILGITRQAESRWDLLAIRVIHRVGKLCPGDQIVFVGVAGRHRGETFQAANFIMDYLKSEAPFWKKQLTHNGSEWVSTRSADRDALLHWQATSGD